MTHYEHSKAMRGVAPVLIILAVVLIGGAVYVVMNRNVVKEYFQTGDKPTQEQFGDVIDSTAQTSDLDRSAGKGNEQGVVEARILTESQKEFSLTSKQAVTFRWTPPSPKPQEPVAYKLRVWQLMQGQNGAQAMRENTPVVIREIAGTEATVSDLYIGPCKPPYLCDFIWSTEVVTAASVGTGASADTGTR